MLALVAVAGCARAGGLAGAEAGQQAGEIVQAMGDEVDDLALALDAAMDREHAGAEDHPSLLLEHVRPDDDIGAAGLVLDGDEQDALGGARHLPHQHETGGPEPASIPGPHRLGTGDDALVAQVPAEEGG